VPGTLGDELDGVPKALKATLPSGSHPRPSMIFTDASRNGRIRSVCVKVCFSPDGRMVHARSLHAPSVSSRGLRAGEDVVSASKVSGYSLRGTQGFWRGTGKAEGAKLPDAETSPTQCPGE
jgi:hypothetical protein